MTRFHSRSFCRNAILVSGDTNNHQDIFVHDLQSGETSLVSLPSDGTQANGDSWTPSISDDGRLVSFLSRASNLVDGDTNNVMDIFVHDRLTGETIHISVSSEGAQANYRSWGPAISADGRFVMFASYAGNLVSGDTNGMSNIYVWDRGMEEGQ